MESTLSVLFQNQTHNKDTKNFLDYQIIMDFSLSIFLIIFITMEQVIINTLLYVFFFIMGVRFGRNVEKLKKQKDDES